MNQDFGKDRPRPTGRFVRPQRPVLRPRPLTRGPVFVQVYFQSVPGARKQHFEAVQPMITQHLHGMVHRGQLVISGGFPLSLGGMWLLKVRSREEAERLVREHPAVAANLLRYRILELQEPLGAMLQGDGGMSRAPRTEERVFNAFSVPEIPPEQPEPYGKQ